MLATSRTNTFVKLVSLVRNAGQVRTLSASVSKRVTRTRAFICDNPESVAQARGVLQNAPYVLFDYEGHGVRNSNGSQSVSLVQMGTPHADETFIFDMISLRNSRQATSNVLSLIGNSKLLKVGWGGVEDFSAMTRIYKEPIRPFLDLQLVDVHSRIRRRESREVQVSRLACGDFPASIVRRMQIDGVHRLSRMDEALVEHEISGASLKERHKGRWFERPLRSSDIRYAANDIIRISELYNHFKNSRVLSVKLLADAISQTSVYMDLYGPTGILSLRKRFVPSNILPLDIINISISNASFFTRNRDLKKCSRCQRSLSLDCFPFSTIGNTADMNRLSICKVCVFIVKKEQYIFQNAAKMATRFASTIFKRNS